MDKSVSSSPSAIGAATGPATAGGNPYRCRARSDQASGQRSFKASTFRQHCRICHANRNRRWGFQYCLLSQVGRFRGAIDPHLLTAFSGAGTGNVQTDRCRDQPVPLRLGRVWEGNASASGALRGIVLYPHRRRAAASGAA